MSQKMIDTQIRAAGYLTLAAADQAIRRLLDTGFSKDQLLVICPVKFQDHFRQKVPHTEIPAGADSNIVQGGLVGATLGGIALVATALTGGAALGAAAVLIGGGALAGGFANLIVSKGYEGEAEDLYKEAVEKGRIVVAVEVHGEQPEHQLAQACRILGESGGEIVETDTSSCPIDLTRRQS